MRDIYAIRPGPSYRAVTREEMFDAAMSMPMSLGSTFWDQAKGGALESFGLGTAIRNSRLPEAAPTEPGVITRSGGRAGTALGQRINPPEAVEERRRELGALTEEEYRRSPYFREEVPWDAGMTEDRAAALATMYDVKRVRQFYAEKRPITAFLGALAGQFADPINYIPVAGPLVRSAAMLRLGRIGGMAASASLDAATNTAVFGAITAEERAKFGDDVSWQAQVSMIATAALIGGAFGTVLGAVGARYARRAASARAEAETRLATLRTTQEARIALNEAIGAVARGEDVALSPNATAPIERAQKAIIAYHASPHSFERFDSSKIGTGEGAQEFGYGLYFAEKEAVAKTYQDDLATTVLVDGKPIYRNNKRVGSTGDREVDDFLVAHNGSLDDAVRVAKEYADDEGTWGRRDSGYYNDLAEKLERLRGRVEVTNDGHFYEVAIEADRDKMLDWDKPLSEQGDFIREALKDMKPEHTGAQIYESRRLVPGDFMDKRLAAEKLKERGILGIKYLDQFSRGGGEGTRNFVVFDDGLVRIRAKNGAPLDTSPPRPEPIPEGRKQAENALSQPDDYKSLAAQYRVDPETGTFVEEPELRQLAQEGRLTEDDAAALDAADVAYQDGAAYGEALKAAVACLI